MIDIEIEDDAWDAALPDAHALARRAAEAALAASPPAASSPARAPMSASLDLCLPPAKRLEGGEAMTGQAFFGGQGMMAEVLRM